MARKALPKGDPIAVYNPEGGYTIHLPDSIRKNLAAMRRLNHQMVDLIADYGLIDWLVHDVEMRLMTLADDILGDFVLALVRNAKAGNQDHKTGPGRTARDPVTRTVPASS